MISSRQVQLKARPNGPLRQDDFEIVTVELAPLQEGEVLIRNLWMSIDAGQRTLMNATTELVDLPPKLLGLHEALEGQAIGQIVESRNPDIAVGTFVANNFGWREYAKYAGAPDGFHLRVLDQPADPIQSHLHVNSIYGATAYFHVTDCARVRAGETVWISTAAGTTGSLACQIAKISGCKVIGTTSSDEKADWLRDELQLDAAFNYRSDDLRAAIRSACPEGVDVFIDYAGGAQLEAAIDLINVHGRIIKVGDTSSYDGSPAPGPANMFQLILKRVDMLGRSIFDYLSPPARLERAYALLREWVADGQIKVHETVYEGIDQAPQAQIDLFKGKNIGKMLVKLGDPLPR